MTPLEPGFYNMDCMEGMRQFPDGYFDLAIVDPVYGDVPKGGYMNNTIHGGAAKNRPKYHLALWQQAKTGKDYFRELFRVSRNQIIWGAIIFAKKLIETAFAGLYGIRKSRKAYRLRMWSLPGHRLTAKHAFSITHGTG